MSDAQVGELEAALTRVAQAQAGAQEQLERLIRRVDRLDDRVAWLSGDALERRYRERAPSYFHRILRKIRLVPVEELSRLAEAAEEQGQLPLDQKEDLLRADVVIEGLYEAQPAFWLVEVSSVVDKGDVERASRRAAILYRITGRLAISAVAGEQILPDAERDARLGKVWRVLDGIVLNPQD